MAELGFLIKSFILTILITVFLQVQIGQISIEDHAIEAFHNSSTSRFLRETAVGASMLIVRVFDLSKNFVVNTFSDSDHAQKASKINLNLSSQKKKVEESYEEVDP